VGEKEQQLTEWATLLGEILEFDLVHNAFAAHGGSSYHGALYIAAEGASLEERLSGKSSRINRSDGVV
jgi:hypothetical protein